ncbi:hypothetical protein NLM24_14615 [Nocardia zapadnayensis]|nr:hypothetical protein [Nocardia zapadnayensis]MCX0271914.1 hypothetical protein [Nocardia zapadnayensis]
MAAAGCSSEPQSPTAGTDALWLTVPQDDAQWQQVRNRARALDVCALLPREDLAQVGEFSVRTSGPGECEATEAGLPSEGTTVKWSVAVEPVVSDTEIPYGTTKPVGDATVWTVSDTDTRPGTDPAQLPSRSCSSTVRYPSTASFFLQAATQPGTDPCPIVEQLLPTALRQWAAEPAIGTSPDTVVTALTGQDPCTVPRTLDGAVLNANQTLGTCGFTFRGDEILVEYKYQPVISFVSRQAVFTVAGDPVYLYDGGDGHRTYNAVVGPVLNAEESDSSSDGLEPMVSVHGTDAAALEEVTRRIVEKLPNP